MLTQSYGCHLPRTHTHTHIRCYHWFQFIIIHFFLIIIVVLLELQYGNDWRRASICAGGQMVMVGCCVTELQLYARLAGWLTGCLASSRIQARPREFNTTHYMRLAFDVVRYRYMFVSLSKKKGVWRRPHEFIKMESYQITNNLTAQWFHLEAHFCICACIMVVRLQCNRDRNANGQKHRRTTFEFMIISCANRPGPSAKAIHFIIPCCRHVHGSIAKGQIKRPTKAFQIQSGTFLFFFLLFFTMLFVTCQNHFRVAVLFHSA